MAELLLPLIEDGKVDVDVCVVFATVLIIRVVDNDSDSDREDPTGLTLLLDATGVAVELSGLLFVGQLDVEEHDVSVEVEVDSTVIIGTVFS